MSDIGIKLLLYGTLFYLLKDVHINLIYSLMVFLLYRSYMFIDRWLRAKALIESLKKYNFKEVSNRIYAQNENDEDEEGNNGKDGNKKKEE